MSTLLSVLIYRSLCANFRFSVRMHLALMCQSLGTHVPTTWHSRACHLALMCVPLGTHVPTTWHSCACHLALTCLSIGTHVPTTLHSRAYHLALTCLSLGTHVPTTWHSCAYHSAYERSRVQFLVLTSAILTEFYVVFLCPPKWQFHYFLSHCIIHWFCHSTFYIWSERLRMSLEKSQTNWSARLIT
jgi:hypothetical protein